mmetsp:Transcript_11960/g.28762  ORF Transcript_11960/g.28762 Transcript_11960/m.28762 type:complete len:98 (-) Transcript_11960:835-1128(-)
MYACVPYPGMDTKLIVPPKYDANNLDNGNPTPNPPRFVASDRSKPFFLLLFCFFSSSSLSLSLSLLPSSKQHCHCQLTKVLVCLIDFSHPSTLVLSE